MALQSSLIKGGIAKDSLFYFFLGIFGG